MRAASLLLALSLLSPPSASAAAGFCFDVDGSIFVFAKLKLPKQPLAAVPVAGVRDNTSGVSGTAFRNAAGQLQLDLVAGQCFVSVSGLDEALNGSAGFDCLNGFSDTLPWQRIECATIPN
jgi:hypothetical protein